MYSLFYDSTCAHMCKSKLIGLWNLIRKYFSLFMTNIVMTQASAFIIKHSKLFFSLTEMRTEGDSLE